MSSLPTITAEDNSVVGWTDRLALHMALVMEGSGGGVSDLLTDHKITKQELEKYCKDPVFLERVQAYRTKIAAEGLSFKLKAAAQAEQLLDTSWELIHTPDVSPAVKADLIKWTAKMGDLEPKQNQNQLAGNGVIININMGDLTPAPSPAPRIINHIP